MKKLLFLCLATLLLTTACLGSLQALPTPTAHYQIVGTPGKTLLVVVDPSIRNDRSGILSIVNYLCDGKDFCFILFWDDINKAARILPATDAQDHAIIASYIYNKSTGFEQLLVCGLGDC